MSTREKLTTIIEQGPEETRGKMDSALEYAIGCIRKIIEIEDIMQKSEDPADMLAEVKKIIAKEDKSC